MLFWSENKENPKEKDISWRIHVNRTENKSTFDYWHKFLEAKEEKKGLFPSEDIVSEIYTSFRGSDNWWFIP